MRALSPLAWATLALSLAAWLHLSLPAAAAGPELRSPSLAARFSPAGDLRELTFVPSGSPVWRMTMPDTETFWFGFPSGQNVTPNTSRLVSLRTWTDARGQALETVHEHAAARIRLTFTYRIDTAEPSVLKSRYRLDDLSNTRRVFRFYVNTVSNLKATPDCWVVYPYRSGQLIRADRVRDGERPAPGHMWMGFMGYYDDQGHGLLTYARDPAGFLKFGTVLCRSGVTLCWSDVVVLPAGAGYDIPFDYILQPLRAPDTFNDICHTYGLWARRQKWMTSVAEKLRQRPGLQRAISDGIVKDVCWGDLSRTRDGAPVPPGQFIPREQKERIIDDPASFEAILAHARSLERLYSVRPIYRLDGWWGRFDSGYPFVLPVSPRLGGDEKLKWFLDENRRDDRTVVLHDNPIQFDAESPRYDDRWAVLNDDGSKNNVSIWSGNRLVLVSPPCALGPNLEVLTTLRAWGASGMWWDVLGGLAPPPDFNPAAGYPYPGRDSFQQSALRLFAALRRTAPEMVFGTEDGQEQMLPYFDYAPAYAVGPESETTTWAPLNELVYGDCFIEGVGIEGNSRLYENTWRVTSQFYGAILGGDGRAAWTSEYTPVIQAIFEANGVIGAVAGQRMLRHAIDPGGWRASLWPGAVVIGNTDSNRPLDVTLDTPLGTVSVAGLRHLGFVTLTRQGHWVCWGARRLRLNGKLLVATSTPEMIVINNARRLTILRYLYREPTAADVADSRPQQWELACPALSSTPLVSVPSGRAVPLTASGPALAFAAPPLSECYRATWPTQR